MLRWKSAVGLAGVFTIVLSTAYCGDSVSPMRQNGGAMALSATGPSAIVLDQSNGTLNDATPLKTCKTNQNRIRKMAEIRGNTINGPRKTSVRI